MDKRPQTDFKHLVAPEVFQRWEGKLKCYCCGQDYEKGQFRCCKAPNGMHYSRWRERWCTSCKKCPRHCNCVTEPAP